MTMIDNHTAELIGRHLLLDGDGVSIWFQTLQPGEETPWHWHQSVTDRFVTSEGIIAVDTRDERGTTQLSVGGSCAVPPEVRHRIRNVGEQRATVITVQTGGIRDFNAV